MKLVIIINGIVVRVDLPEFMFWELLGWTLKHLRTANKRSATRKEKVR